MNVGAVAATDGASSAATAERTVLRVVAAGLAARVLFAWLAPITVDEAYYVDWARHLAPGYLDHPPLVAWLVAPFLRAFGAHTLAVRAPAVVLQAATTLLAASLARSLAGPRAAAAAALLLQAAPVFSVGGALATPDASLAFGWVAALWALERGLRRDPRWLVATGAFLGVAALSKLTAGLLGIALFLALALSRDGRRLLATPWPWAGAALALLIASPMIAWNAARDWPSLRFQAHHGMRGGDFSLVRLARSIGQQAGYVSPLVLALAAAAAARAFTRRDGARLALALSGLPVVLFFTASASFTPRALPHWPAPGWLSAAILLAAAPVATSGARVFRAAVGLGFAVTGLLLALLALPLPGASALDELRGWREGVEAARAAAGGARLATTHWIPYGQLGFHAGESLAYVSDRPSGPTFYDGGPAPRGVALLIVAVDGLGPARWRLEWIAGPLEPAGSYTVRRDGVALRTYRFYRGRLP
jgi:4-amino-4-deoxy-L-arabinose transferase-like glycosyltransferase